MIKKIEQLDSAVLKKHHCSLSELLLLLESDNFSNLLSPWESLLEKGLVQLKKTDSLIPLKEYCIKITPLGEKLLQELRYNNTNVYNEELIKSMRELFPEGKKPGTSLYWRGQEKELLLRLERFAKIYGFYSPEKILKATKNYVDTFNGQYTFMQVLKYFIIKDKITGESKETVSALAESLSNEDQDNYINFSELK